MFSVVHGVLINFCLFGFKVFLEVILISSIISVFLVQTILELFADFNEEVSDLLDSLRVGEFFALDAQ